LGKRWPALDVEAAGDSDAEHVLAAADDFAPTAIEETPAGLRLFFTTSAERDVAARALEQQFRVSPTDIDDQDWARRSQEGLGPVTVGRITILPAPPARLDPFSLVITPSMGFGTGHHATTRLCLAALQAIDLKGLSVLDAGTGSGVLAMAAVLLGASDALGLDDDADAVQSANENLADNPAVPAGCVTFRVGDLMTGPLPQADVVTANLTGGLLIRAAHRLQRAVRPGGYLIMSGLQVHERDEVWEAFDGLDLVAEAEEGGWSTLTGSKRSNGYG
jgi:ribosomal protein L11 methyltransferase